VNGSRGFSPVTHMQRAWESSWSRSPTTEIVVGMDVGQAHTNFLGVGHGGMVFSLADCAFSLASNNAGDAAVAIDTHLVLTAATRPGHRLTARVREVSRGRTLGTYRAEVARDDGRTVALFTGTVYINRS
jgi:acyl-CoA thioesterase